MPPQRPSLWNAGLIFLVGKVTNAINAKRYDPVEYFTRLPHLTDFISSQTQLLFSLSSYKVGWTPSVALSPDLMVSHTASAATIPLFIAVCVPLIFGTFMKPGLQPTRHPPGKVS